LLTKSFHGFFNIAFRKARISKVSHSQRLEAVKNGGTSLYRTQLVDKLRFSTSCWL